MFSIIASTGIIIFFWILLECVSPIFGHTRVHPLTAKGLGGTVTTVGASKVAGKSTDERRSLGDFPLPR